MNKEISLLRIVPYSVTHNLAQNVGAYPHYKVYRYGRCHGALKKQKCYLATKTNKKQPAVEKPVDCVDNVFSDKRIHYM
ncbi:hypothetical protein C9J12_06535 [Photobacterium frigidiphilum]|uniref:Uncharacterized protein n=1 Tax=Photobacterium frigidiphilum TaxID=264736 RepID=A0A2T3JLC1_9GAMM|nr:hypothetical protein C9J12_06535 [Photobacterium frigidiphilum]